jgi:outer membrane receptor protein involved in Fe transport
VDLYLAIRAEDLCRYCLSVTLLVTTCGMAVPCLAQSSEGADEPADASSTEQTPQTDEAPIRVETRARAERSIDDGRFPSGFVTRIDLEDRAAGTDLSDALARVAGLRMRRASSFGQPSFASIRGGNPRQLSVSLNDMRISVPSGYGFDVGSLALAGIDAVDVHRGSSATVYGGGALTGALNLRAGPPRDEGWTASAGTMGGSFGTFGLRGQTAYASQDASIQLDANWRRSDGDFGYRDAQGTDHTRINNDHEHLSVLAAGRFELGDHKLEPTLMFDGGGAGVAGPGEFEREFSEARVDTRRTIGQLRWSSRGLHAGDWGVLDAHASVGYQHRETDYLNTNSFPGGARVDDRTRHSSVSVQGGLETWLSFGDMLHANVEARREAYDSTHVQDGSTSELAVERYTVAPSVSNELLALDQAVSIVTSVRLETTHERVLEQATPSLDDLDGRHWTDVIPAVGVSWRLEPWLTLKTNAARTFRAPDFDELYLDIVGMRGTPGLEPERAWNLDLGATLGRSDEGVSAEIVGFYNDVDQMIQFVATTAYLFEARNLGSGRSYGLESTVAWRPLDRLSLSGSYTWTESALVGLDGTLIPGQPRHRATANARLNLESVDWLGALPGLALRSAATWRSSINLDPFGNLQSEAYWTVDAGAQVRPWNWLQMGINVRNITDNRWGADSLQRPLPGRAIFVTAGAAAGPLKND